MRVFKLICGFTLFSVNCINVRYGNVLYKHVCGHQCMNQILINYIDGFIIRILFLFFVSLFHLKHIHSLLIYFAYWFLPMCDMFRVCVCECASAHVYFLKFFFVFWKMHPAWHLITVMNAFEKVNISSLLKTGFLFAKRMWPYTSEKHHYSCHMCISFWTLRSLLALIRQTCYNQLNKRKRSWFQEKLPHLEKGAHILGNWHRTK